MKPLVTLVFIMFFVNAFAQTGIGTTTPDASAQLEVSSTSKGFLPPRMTAAQRAAISSPVAGLMVYQTDGTAGYYHYNGTSWEKLVKAVDLSNGTLDGNFNSLTTGSISATSTTYPDTYWDDLQVNLSSVNLKDTKEPNWIVYKGGYILSFQEGNEEGLYFTAQLPHGYKNGSDIQFHVHLVFPGSGAGNTDWTFTYTWANIGEDFSTESTLLNIVVASPADADRHSIGGIATIDGTGKKGSSVLLCSLTRNANIGSDTYSGNVYMVALDFHYELDKPGSNNVIPD